MAESDSVIIPPWWRRHSSLRQFVIDHNPFFILSAVCMLGGCLALTNSLSWSPIPLSRVILLVITLNIYELMLIALAIFLIARRRLVRDGTILLMLEAFFLVDVTFLNSELFTASLRVGTIANALLLALAFVKVTAIFVGLGISMRDGAFALILIELAMLFVMPGAFKQLASRHGGSLHAGAIYASWWVIGLIPVIATLLLRTSDGPGTGRLTLEIETARPRAAVHARSSRALMSMLMLLPVISLLAHVSTSNWVYKVRWYPANVTPLILGLALALGAYDRHVISLATRMRAQLALPMLAILLSWDFPSALTFHIAGMSITPLRLALAGATLVYLHGLLLHRHIYYAWAACACVLTSLFGPSPQDIGQNMTYVGRETKDFSWSLIPRTVRDWGIASIGASFVLLAIGALVSLFKEPPNELEQQASASPSSNGE